MNLQESIRRILRESTYFLRRIDLRLMEKEFFENLNYATDVFLIKYDNNQSFEFKDFKNRVISYLMDDYHNELSNGGSKDFPYDEVYEYLSNHFHDKIEKRFNTLFSRNINETYTGITPTDTTQQFINKPVKLVGDVNTNTIIRNVNVNNDGSVNITFKNGMRVNSSIPMLRRFNFGINVPLEFKVRKK